MSIRINTTEVIIKENIGLIKKVIDSLRLENMENYDYDELFDTGMIALANAAMTYDDNVGVQFSTYACSCIRNGIKNYLKVENKKFRISMVSIETIISSDNEKETTLEDMIFDSSINFEEMEQNQIVENIINTILSLNKDERQIMLYTIAGVEQEKIGEKLGLGRGAIAMRLKKTREKLYGIFPNYTIADDIRIEVKNQKFILRKGSDTIILPAEMESFSVIAEILSDDLQKIEKKYDRIEGIKIADEVRNYILTLREFESREIIEHFSKLPVTTVRTTINNAVRSGKIKRSQRGKYVVNKN